MHTQQTNCQATPKAAEQTILHKEGSAIVSNPAVKFFSSEERADFYTGQDRLTLQNAAIQRVRVLQEENDALQRKIAQNQQALGSTSDPLVILAEIEHCNIIISRNTGEILTIYTQNEQRLKRISQLKHQNEGLRQDLHDSQEKFSSCHEMQTRTKIASEFFLAKSQFEKNIEEIEDLKIE